MSSYAEVYQKYKRGDYDHVKPNKPNPPQAPPMSNSSQSNSKPHPNSCAYTAPYTKPATHIGRNDFTFDRKTSVGNYEKNWISGGYNNPKHNQQFEKIKWKGGANSVSNFSTSSRSSSHKQHSQQQGYTKLDYTYEQERQWNDSQSQKSWSSKPMNRERRESISSNATNRTINSEVDPERPTFRPNPNPNANICIRFFPNNWYRKELR